MCEKRVEKAATSLKGVTKANWDKETKMIEVTFDSKQNNIDDIHKAIADVEHGTEKMKAKDNVYNDLPGCCKYDRKKENW
jgi:copper chaperone CopZ